MTYTQLDGELRRRLAGARLVCEVELEDDLVFEIRKAWLFTQAKKSAFVREYPAIGVVFLAQWGVDHYQEREFWPLLKLGTEQNRVGEAFEAALPTLGLETFPQFRVPGQASARRFVAPILAHGGIPGSLAHDFLTEVLFPAVRRAPGATGAELIARWRRDPPPGLRTTVGRFLLYGGKTAVDLVDRLIGLAAIPRADLEAGAETGVPRHLVKAYLAVPEALVPAARRTLPRPSIELDPWGDEGPVLRLPQLVREDGEGLTWSIEDGSGAAKSERGYPRRDLTPLPLFPADEWSVTARRGGEAILERTYECFGGNQMLCFDDGRDYLSDVEGVRADAAWIVTRKGVALASLEAEGYRPLSGETTTFHGPWSKHQAVRLDLSTVAVLCALEGGAEIGRVQVLRAGSGRPQFSTGAMADVHSREGLEVRASLPTIVLPPRATWLVRLSGPGESFSRTETVGDLPATVDLAELAGAAPMGPWDVSATGPLGSDFRASFVLVPGLSVGSPAAPVGPEVGEVKVEVWSSDRSLRFPGRAPGEPYAVVFLAGETHGEAWVYSRDHDAKTGLLISIPRIQWAFRGGAVVPEMGSRVLAFAPEDLGETIPALLLSVGRGDVAVRVLLEDAEGDRLLLAGAGRTTPDGTFRVDLGGTRDTARACAARGLRLEAVAGETSVLVGYHLPAPQGRQPSAGGEVSVFQRDFTVTVIEVRPSSLAVSTEEWDGTIYEDRLPKPISSYKPGDTLTARITAIGEKVRFDARVFDPSAFRLGETLTGRVSKVVGAGLRVSARGHELIVDEQRLPADRPAASWRTGEEITGKVVSINPVLRKIRLSVAPFDPGSLKPGDPVQARVTYAAEVVFASVNGQVGYMRNGDRPPTPVRTGDLVSARVTRIDRKRDQIDLTCRPFNAAGYAAGDRVAGEITGVRDREAWVRLPGGEPAWIPLHGPLEEAFVNSMGVGSTLEVVVTSVDRVRSRIAATVADVPAAVVGDAGPAESPFAKLSGFRPARNP